jgi:hypothetical protein
VKIKNIVDKIYKIEIKKIENLMFPKMTSNDHLKKKPSFTLYNINQPSNQNKNISCNKSSLHLSHQYTNNSLPRNPFQENSILKKSSPTIQECLSPSFNISRNKSFSNKSTDETTSTDQSIYNENITNSNESFTLSIKPVTVHNLDLYSKNGNSLNNISGNKSFSNKSTDETTSTDQSIYNENITNSDESFTLSIKPVTAPNLNLHSKNESSHSKNESSHSCIQKIIQFISRLIHQPSPTDVMIEKLNNNGYNVSTKFDINLLINDIFKQPEKDQYESINKVSHWFINKKDTQNQHDFIASIAIELISTSTDPNNDDIIGSVFQKLAPETITIDIIYSTLESAIFNSYDCLLSTAINNIKNLKKDMPWIQDLGPIIKDDDIDKIQTILNHSNENLMPLAMAQCLYKIKSIAPKLSHQVKAISEKINNKIAPLK